MFKHVNQLEQDFYKAQEKKDYALEMYRDLILKLLRIW